MNLYTIEKIRQLETERLSSKYIPPEPEKPRRKPVFGGLAAGAGRTLRRVGEGLESWATPPHCEQEPQPRQESA